MKYWFFVPLVFAGCSQTLPVKQVHPYLLSGHASNQPYQSARYFRLLRNSVSEEKEYAIEITPITISLVESEELDDAAMKAVSKESQTKQVVQSLEKFVNGKKCARVVATSDTVDGADVRHYGFAMVDDDKSEHPMKLVEHEKVGIGGVTLSHYKGQFSLGDERYVSTGVICREGKPFDGKSFGISVQPRFRAKLDKKFLEWVATEKPVVTL